MHSIAISRDNRKWIGYAYDGISILSADNLTWVHETDKLIGGAVNDIATSPNGDVWVAGDNGGGGGDTRSSQQNATVTRVYNGRYFGQTISGGYWGSVQIGGGLDYSDSDQSRLSYTTLESGGIGDTPGLSLFYSAPTLDHLTIRGSGGDGLLAQESAGFTLDTAVIESNEGDGIHIQGGYGNHTLTAIQSRYNSGGGLELEFAGHLTVTSATLAYNYGYGLFTHYQFGGPTLVLQGSLISNNTVAARLPANTVSTNNVWSNNGRNEIEWAGGTITGNRIWDEGINSFVVVQDITVADGTTLTIPAGTKVFFHNGAGLTVNGALVAEGTAEQTVYFGPATSYSGWDGLFIGGGAIEGDSDSSSLSYAIIQRAYQAIYLYQSTPTLDHLTLVRNDTGLYTFFSDGVTINQSNFADNFFYGLYNATPGYVITATSSYWGAFTGPRHPSNPNGTGDRVSDGVVFAPWNSKPVFIDGLDYVLVRQTGTDYTTLTYDENDNTYTRHYPDGREVHFDDTGHHMYTLESDGRRTVYSYNPDGTTASVGIIAPGADDPHWLWSFAYTDGILSHITDPAGRITSFTHNNFGHLTQVNLPGEYNQRFYYDANGRMTQQINENGSITSYRYDAFGRLIQHIDAPHTVYEPMTGQFIFTQEIRTFNPSDTTYPLINDSVIGDPDNPAPAVPLSAGLIDGVVYGIGGRSGYTNEYGKWVELTDALGRTITYKRDAANNPIRITFPNGDCMTASYDFLGNITAVTRLAAAQCGLPLERVNSAASQSASFSYEPRFNQIKMHSDPLGNTTYYYYDYEMGLGEAGKLIRIVYPPIEDENGMLVTPEISYTYNIWGLLETQTNRRGTVTRYVYTQGTPDEAYGGANSLFAPGVMPVPGLLTHIIQDEGGINLTTTYKDFNALGLPLTEIGPGGQPITTYTYDELGRRLSETDAAGITTTYEYDGVGRLVRRVKDFTPDGVTGRNIVTTYQYDARDNLLSESTAADGLLVQTNYRYNINSWRVSEINTLGQETRYIYDLAGQLLNVIDPAGNIITNTYNLKGELAQETNASGYITSYSYDELGRVITETHDEDGLNLTTLTTYDLNGNRLTTALDGTVTCYEYDILNRLIANIQDCTGLALKTEYTYNLNGNLVLLTDPRGVTTYTEYDALDRTILTRRDVGGLNLETSLTYDMVGNLATTTDERGVITVYIYDDLNRLLQQCSDPTGLNLCIGYGYDRLGNQDVITDANGVVQQTIYNAFDVPSQVIQDVNGLAAITLISTIMRSIN